jgi:hypothetical protein
MLVVGKKEEERFSKFYEWAGSVRARTGYGGPEWEGSLTDWCHAVRQANQTAL